MSTLSGKLICLDVSTRLDGINFSPAGRNLEAVRVSKRIDGHLAAEEEIMHSISALAAFWILAPVLQVEEPITQGKLTVYVVRASQTDSRSYITLDEGLKSGAVELRERGSGDVNSLEVENGSDKYLFLHVGDIIRGGKQDRTIATDVLIPPRSAPIAVDAFCVEHGRWRPYARRLRFFRE